MRAIDVAERFGVSPRTVYRDMKALGHAGFPLEGNAGDGYRLSQEAYLKPLARATSKLQAALGPTARRRVAQLDARITVPDLARSTAPTLAMLEAIRERRVASLSYVDPRSSKRTRRALGELVAPRSCE